MKRLRVLIVGDLLQVREGLATVLTLAGSASETGIEIVGEARSGLEAIQKAHLLQPEVMVIDMETPELDGNAVTRRIKAEQPAMRLILLSIHDAAEVQQLARAAGADGFITKGERIEHLLQAMIGNRNTTTPTTPTEGEIT